MKDKKDMENKESKNGVKLEEDSQNEGIEKALESEKTKVKKAKTKEKSSKRFLESSFVNWVFFVEEHDKNNEKFSEKHSKDLSILRIILSVLLILLFPLYCPLLKEFFNAIADFNWWKCLFFLGLLIVVYVLIRIYWDWIKKVWKFLKEDRIVHYIFLIMIPIGIIFWGYRRFFPPGDSIEVSDLNGFYASLFTAIAVIAAIGAFIGWGKIKDLSEKLEKFKKVEEKVNRLHKQKDLAGWAKKVVAGAERSCITSFEIKYNDDEKEKVKEIISTLSDDYTENGWLEIIYAKEIFNNKNDKERFRKAFSIFDLIIQKNIANNNHDTSLEGVVFHMLGQVFWIYYNEIKDNFYKKERDISRGTLRYWSDQKAYNISDKMVFKSGIVEDGEDNKSTIPVKELLEISYHYYEMALEVKKKKDKNWDETLANLAIVLIELYKITEGYVSVTDKPLEEAETYLNEIPEDRINFNTYWDLARIYFYKGENPKEVSDNLYKAINDIEKANHKKVFLKGIENECKEIGFPGIEGLIDDLKKELNQMKYLK